VILVNGSCCQERAHKDDLSILKVAGLSFVPDQESRTSSSGPGSGSVSGSRRTCFPVNRPRLQWPAHYPSGQCLYPACAGGAGPGHKELQVLDPRPNPQPVSAACLVRAAEPAASERERERREIVRTGERGAGTALGQSQQLPAWDGQTTTRPARIRPSQPSELLSAQLATGQ